MASNTVRVSVEADSRDFERGFDRSTAKAAGFGAAIGTMAATLAIDLGRRALGAVKQFVGDSIQAFSDLEQAVGGTEAVFGESSDAIDEFAKISAEAIGLSEAEFRTATTLIGGQLKRMTGDVDFAAEQSIILTEVGADLAATYGGTTKEAVEALGSAFRGEADPAERFNLNLKIGAQNAKAVELGLADTTTEVDDAARAQATLALIMEQSADAQGQFAREADTHAGKQQRLNAALEDQKALLGEALIPLANQWLDIQREAIPVIGELAAEVGLLTGAYTDGQAALSLFLQAHGDVPKSAEDVIEAAKTLGITWGDVFTNFDDVIAQALTGERQFPRLNETLEDLIRSGDLSADALGDMGGELDDLVESGHLTEEQAADLAKILDTRLKSSLTDAEESARGFFNAQEDLTEVTDETIDSLEDQVSAIDEVIAANQRATDPFLQTLHAQRKLKTAQDEYNEALEEFGPDSEEAVEAAGNLIEANNELDGALATIAEEGGPNWRAEFRRVASQAGIAEDTIDEMIAAIEKADGLTATATINVDIAAALERLASLRRAGLSAIPSGLPGGVGLHSGGIVSEGLLDGNRSNRREAVLPLDTHEGKRALAQAVAEAMNGNGTGGGIYITVNALDPQSAADAVVRAIEDWRRRNGNLPFSA